MKKLVYVISTVLACGGIAFAQAAVPVFAADSTLGGQKTITTANKLETRIQNQPTKAAEKSANQLQTVIEKADTLITNRLNSLNELSNRIQGDTRLTDSEKSNLMADIQKDVSGLMALKAKIDADKDVTTAKADAKQVITSYYVYALFEPKTRLLMTLNNMQTTQGYVQALVPQLQNLINTLKSQGKDVSQLQPVLDDISTQLKTSETTINNDITIVQNVSISDKGTAQTTFFKVRQDLSQIIRSSFAKIRSDFAKMRPLFKQLVGTVSVTPSVTTLAPTAQTSETPSTSPAPTQ